MTLPPDDTRVVETVAKLRTPQIRPRLQDAVRLIVTEGLSIADAARRSGMTPHSLQVALKKPHVRAFMAHVKDAWMESRTSKAWTNIADLADRATSEDVKLKANRVFLEAAGELGGRGDDPSKLAKTLVQIVINAAQSPGQLTDGQVSGVIEAQPWRAIPDHTSNSAPVGRPESEGDDDDGD